MTETFHAGVPRERLHFLKPAWQLPFDELASHSRVGITPQIGKGGVGPLCDRTGRRGVLMGYQS
jgi:hypothetical protein